MSSPKAEIVAATQDTPGAWQLPEIAPPESAKDPEPHLSAAEMQRLEKEIIKSSQSIERWTRAETHIPFAREPGKSDLKENLDKAAASKNSDILRAVEPPKGEIAEGRSTKGTKKRSGDDSSKEDVVAVPHQIPLVLNANVHKWIKYFTEKDRERFSGFLLRAQYYGPTIRKLLKRQGVPNDLLYLAMIESGLVPHAQSPENAVGMWQFVSETGKYYGLHADTFLDERRDPIRATEAAAHFLNDLHRKLKNWYLALASYNAGETRIRRAVEAGRTNDFWKLAASNLLPEETLNYVPKFIAATMIAKNPAKYGFKASTKKRFPQVEAVKIPSAVRLSDIALMSGIHFDDLRGANPHLRRDLVPFVTKQYALWIPKDKVARVKRLIGKLELLKVPGPDRHNREYLFAYAKKRFETELASLQSPSTKKTNRAPASTNKSKSRSQKSTKPTKKAKSPKPKKAPT